MKLQLKTGENHNYVIVCEQSRKIKVTFSLPEFSSFEHIPLFYSSHGMIEAPTNQYLFCDSLPLCSRGLPGERSGEASIFMSRLNGFIVEPWHELDNWLAGPFLSPNPSCSFRNPSTKREHLLSMRGHAPRQTATPTFFHKCVNLLLPQTHHHKWAIQKTELWSSSRGRLQFAYFQKRVTVFFLTAGGDIMRWHYYCFQASDSGQWQEGKPVQQMQYSFIFQTARQLSQKHHTFRHKTQLYVLKKQVIFPLNLLSNLCNADKGVSANSSEQQGCLLLLCNRFFSPLSVLRFSSTSYFERPFTSQKALERQDRETVLDMVHLCQHWNIQGDVALPDIWTKRHHSWICRTCLLWKPKQASATVTSGEENLGERRSNQLRKCGKMILWGLFWNVLLPLTVGINLKDTMPHNIFSFFTKN